MLIFVACGLAKSAGAGKWMETAFTGKKTQEQLFFFASGDAHTRSLRISKIRRDGKLNSEILEIVNTSEASSLIYIIFWTLPYFPFLWNILRGKNKI